MLSRPRPIIMSPSEWPSDLVQLFQWCHVQSGILQTKGRKQLKFLWFCSVKFLDSQSLTARRQEFEAEESSSFVDCRAVPDVKILMDIHHCCKHEGNDECTYTFHT
jgi:hypothetical protein